MLAGDLVHGLITSTDGESSSEAIKKADAYLQRDQPAESRANPSSSLGGGGQDRTIINRGPPKNVGSGESVGTAASAAAPTSDMGRSCTALYISINPGELCYRVFLHRAKRGNLPPFKLPRLHVYNYVHDQAAHVHDF